MTGTRGSRRTRLLKNRAYVEWRFASSSHADLVAYPDSSTIY
jgi:hypothetical protein